MSCLRPSCSCKMFLQSWPSRILQSCACIIMFKVCKSSLNDSKNTSDLCDEEDEQPVLACTSQLRRWHKKGRKDKISAQPVIEVAVLKMKLDETRSRESVKCLLYEARADEKHIFLAKIKLKKPLQEINSGMGLAILAPDDSSLLPSVEIKFGKCPVGAFGCYQLTHNKANFVPFIDISTVIFQQVNSYIPGSL